MIWYPYTQMKTMAEPIEIVGAEGVYLKTEEKTLIDSVSSWWCKLHGYNHKELNAALSAQVDQFSHVMLGGITHKPIRLLTEKLVRLLPKDLDYCFYSDSGSVAVEVAIKMGLQYFSNKGIHDRKKILSLKHSYHGDTFKTMEVGDDSDYHFAFDKKDNVIHINTTIRELEAVFEREHENLGIMIVEPLLQGAGGMRMYDVEFLERARTLCDEHEVLLIFDEVATGFGRTGHMFVSDLVCPDIVVLGKALTGGYIGHAATVTNKKVFDAFYSDNPDHAFMHGPTFMGNALACSVALKSLEIFERENYMEKVKRIEALTCDYFKDFAHPLVKDVRIMGAVLCIEVHDASSLNGFKAFAYEKGVFNRPFLNYLYTCVPFIITEEELTQIFDVLTAWFHDKR